MGVSGQRHAPEKGPPVPIVQESRWAPEPVWTQKLEKKSFRICRGSNHDRPVVQPVARHHTDWAMRLTSGKDGDINFTRLMNRAHHCFEIIHRNTQAWTQSYILMAEQYPRNEWVQTVKTDKHICKNLL
jgi:hypothetical protein